MRFWDSSAIVPLLCEEEASARMRDTLRQDPALAVWWATPIECVSALARGQREGKLSPSAVQQSVQRLREAMLEWATVPATPDVREQAMRLVRVHRVRAADAMQLAAAIVASDFQPSGLEVVTLDERLAEVAELEGFSVVR